MAKPRPTLPPPLAARFASAARRLPQLAWHRLRAFSGLGSDATYLWPRWLLLRAVGLVFGLIFAGLLREGPALVGPGGLVPLGPVFARLEAAASGPFAAFLQAPGLFWLGSGATAIALVAWTGLAAAVSLILNLWPRAALCACWTCLLSFVTSWQVFSGTQLDQFMLETALVCLPFAPAGFRPGLGAKSPPRPLAVFMVRWLLFRVMFESGVLKLIAGEVRWWDFTALDVLYETAPFPTVLGFFDHQLPHACHVAEFALTFVAELAAPLLAVFAGRRGRGFAFVVWTVFQAGIQLTNNFGWLNAGSIALGLILLDDQMIAAAARACGLARLREYLAARTPPPTDVPPPLRPWARYGLRAALGAHFALTLVVFFQTCRGAITDTPITLPQPWATVAVLRSANAYTLYANLLPYRFAVEFEGSNDGGVTWRPYDYRYQPQRPDQISPFIAPWYPRFEATLQVQANGAEPSPLFAAVADHLLARNPAVLARFRADPFPDRPATMIRIRGYRLSFVDLPTHRATGQYWRKQVEGDYLPLRYRDAQGAIAAAVTENDLIFAHALHGNRDAQTQLGKLYAFGTGLPRDRPEAVRWFRRAADQGQPAAQFYLGVAYAGGEGVARDESEALARFQLAERSGFADAAGFRAALESRLGPARSAAAQRRSEVIAAEIAARTRTP
jgi:hypothetical protein